MFEPETHRPALSFVSLTITVMETLSVQLVRMALIPLPKNCALM